MVADLKHPLSTPSIHEQIIEARFLREMGRIVDDAALRVVHREFSRARALHEQCVAVWDAQMNDPTLPLAGRIIKAKQAVTLLATKAAGHLDAAASRLRTELTTIRKASWRPNIPLSPEGIQVQSEIRAQVRAMDAKQRLSALSKPSDDLVMAITAGPPEVSGLSANEVESIRQEWRSRAHPEIVEREKRLILALADTDRAGVALHNAVRRAFEQHQAAIRSHEQAVVVSEKAAAAVAQTDNDEAA
jgi:hypothetical protein